MTRAIYSFPGFHPFISSLKRPLGCRPSVQIFSHQRPYALNPDFGRKRSVPGPKMSISTDVKEEKLRRLLLDVAKYIDESKEIQETLELRFAGGWVRDKLLGISSHDIDTAINAMTGYAFSLKMKEYLDIPENVSKHQIEKDDVGNLHKIAANPEKSKHLETVTTRIFGLDVDFVNLRKETYSEESRNPQMEFGTAEEDALRRDATINALFYNIHTGEVEDLVGGLVDMQAKLIRTPLEPYQTFMDDPLRVLRLIRFASRLDFSIDPTAETCMSEPSVLEALKLKISRERVGVEVEKMLKGKNPRSALRLIDSLGLYSTIFTDPVKQLPAPSSQQWKASYDCLEELKNNQTPGSIYDSLVRSDDAKYLSWVLVALTPWSQVNGELPLKPGGRATLPYATIVAREGIKVNNKVGDVITGALRNYGQIIVLKDAILSNQDYINERGTIGMQIRKWDSQGGYWRLHALYALLVEAMQVTDRTGYEVLFQQWQKFIDHLHETLDVMDAPTMRPLIDGKILTKALGVKPGIWVRPALDICLEWQLRNPGNADTEAPIKEVRARQDELQIPL
ncbi:poly A polymerase head domain-containing protein [Phlyctema vagabunda]|uniref:Poly A polymerase head domain-containing protein n=1 Tax=Phlyctema vagabunda TaxID=108571 RepID=A0ABR4PRM6_9HELO